MNDPSIRNSAWQSLTNQQLSEIDELCDRFDQELVDGHHPQIETYLSDVPEAAREALFSELLVMEIEYQTQQGEVPQRDVYHQRFPQQGRAITAIFGGVSDETTIGNSTVSDTVSSPVELPNDLGKFRLIEEMGQGGMGVVWLAEQLHPVKRRVALKLVRLELTSKDVIARFDSEKQALAMMDHPNIARVLDAGSTNEGRPYFVMELVEGMSITRYCDENQLSVDERLRLFVPVCKAVQHAHHKGIIHRDLKPSNVLVTVIDGEAVPKVIDFGLAKAIAPDLQLSDMTMQTELGKVVGTIQYMSPEQAEFKGGDGEDIDTRTDIYALGVMLYELLTGSTPLENETLAENSLLNLLEIIREQEPPRPSQRLGLVSSEVALQIGDERKTTTTRLQQLLFGELDWVVMQALEKERTRRYQTVNDLGQDLSRYLSGEAVAARPPSTWYHIQKFTKRHRGLVVALFVIGIVLLVGIAGTSYGLVQANQKAKLAKENAREADEERGKALASELAALRDRNAAQRNEERAVEAEEIASAEKDRARLSEANAKFQLANARWEANRARDARDLLYEIPMEHRDNFEWHYCAKKFEGSDFTCYGHQKPLRAVAYSPLGTRVATVDEEGLVKIWDAKTGQDLHTLRFHRGVCEEVIFSPDGTRLATTGSNKTIQIWEVQTGQPIATLKGNQVYLAGIAFSPDGKEVVSVDRSSTIMRWDAQSGRTLARVELQEAITGAAFSPDGKQCVTCSDAAIVLRDLATGEELTRRAKEIAWPRCVAFSPDAKHLAVAGEEGISVWDSELKQKLWSGAGNAGMILNVEFSPDGTRIVSTGRDQCFHVWEVRSGLKLHTLVGHSDDVTDAAFSPDGARLASVSRDRTLKLWDARSGSRSISMAAHSKGVCSIAYSPDGDRLASVSSDRSFQLWDTQAEQTLIRRDDFFDANTLGTSSVAFSPDGKYLAYPSSDKTVKLLDGRTGKELKSFQGHDGWITSVAFAPNGKRLVSGSQNGTVKLWEIKSGEEIRTWPGEHARTSCVAFSPDGRLVASARDDKNIKLWDAESGQEIRSISGKHPVTNLAFCPNGKRLASSSNSAQTIFLWDTNSGEEIFQLNGHTAGVLGIAFSPDGSRIVSTGHDRTVKLWDSQTGGELITLDIDSHGTHGVAFRPDGVAIAVGNDNGIIKFLAAPREHEVETLTGHTSPILKLSFSRDGTQIYTESKREKLVWDFASRKVIPDAAWNRSHFDIPFSPDGRYLIQADRLNLRLIDFEKKNIPSEKTYRAAKTRFDPVWHKLHVNGAIAEANWYSAVLHYAHLLKNDPTSSEYSVGLHSSFRRLVALDPEDLEALSLLTDSTGESQGNFYTDQQRQTVTTLPASPYQSPEDSPLNHALFFGGSSYAHLGSPAFYSSNFTVEVWIKPSTSSPNPPSSSGTFFTLRPDEKSIAIAVELSNGLLRVIHRNPPSGAGGIILFSKSKVNDGKWHHIALVKNDDDKFHVYLDGKLEATSQRIATDFGEVSCQVYLGINTNQSPRYYSGLIDDLRLWKTARTKEEINKTMKSSLDPDTPGLVVIDDFNQAPQAPILNGKFQAPHVVVESLKLVTEPE